MKKRLFLTGFLILVSWVVPVAYASDLKNYFTTPKEWKAVPQEEFQMVPGKAEGMTVFQTAVEKKDSLMVSVRVVHTGSQSAMKWAEDEQVAIMKQKFNPVEPPLDMTYGSTHFVRMISAAHMKMGTLRDEYYFCEYPQEKALIEVVVVGPESFFDGQRSRIDEFLKSFHF